MKLLIKPLNSLAKEYYSNHNYFHKGDAGLDLYILEDQTFKSGETSKIKLGISCENLEGKGYFLFPRSSISKTPLRMANSIGLIDEGYRGEIMAVCDNIKNYEFSISKGDRLFQLVSTDLSSIEFKIVDELSDSTRGEGGFGSTGT
jgi:dUTP pyrophosphatase